MMVDMRHLQNCTYNWKMSTITHQNVSGQRKKAFRRVRSMAQTSVASHALIETQMITQRECSSFDCRSPAVRPSSSSTTGKECSCVCTGVDVFCTKGGAVYRHVKVAKRLSNLKPAFYFGLLILSFCAVANAQFYSPAYMNSLSSGVGSRFKNFVGVGDLKIAVFTNISEAVREGKLVGVVQGKYTQQSTNKIYYRIDRASDPKRQFSVDENGRIQVAHALDREEIPQYSLKIEAFDEGGNSDSLAFNVAVLDENDNAPIPYTVPPQCIFTEHVAPQLQPPCEIRAIDRDTIENGPPFTMRPSNNFKYQEYLNLVFSQSGDNGNGSMMVTPKVEFDREQPPGKYLEIPLIVADRHNLSSEQSVFILIGDINDSDMTDGTANIYVYSYLGRMEKTVIGRVYVNDQDDWDLPDKTFTWGVAGPVSGFSLAGNGEITMDANMPPGQYILTSTVVDNKRNQRATGTVNVEVIAVPQIAFDNQGVLRILYGSPGGYISPDVFLRVDSQGSSPMTRFVDKMVEYLGPDVSIQVFSIQPSEANLQTSALKVIDVRFSAFGGKLYRSPITLNGLIMQHRSELERIIGATIVSGGIDMCKFTTCDRGCQTVHSANEAGYVVSANQTVIVGINAWSNDSCTCPVFEPPNSCEAGLCRNGGVCHNTYPKGFFCECRNNALKGFRCQGTTRSFNGAGYAWFKPVPACTSLNLSFEFMTTQTDGLLLYNGPMGDNITQGHLDYRDYLIVRLANGRLEAEMMFNGLDTNVVQVTSGSLVNDGKWHAVALTQIGKSIELVLDNCAPGDETPISTDSSCRRVVTTRDDDERLNVITPLQVGGLAPLSEPDRYPNAVTSKPQTYNGCVRNLVVNGEKYDLGVPDQADEQNSQSGCNLNAAVCGMESASESYCVHGECIADASSNVPKCVCDPGYGGDRCEQAIEWVEFSANAFIQYDVAIVLETKKSDVDVLLYPGTRNYGSGALGHATDGGFKYMGTYLNSYTPGGHFDCGNTTTNSSVDLRMDNLQLANNYSYWLQFSRNPVKASLTVDGSYYLAKQLDPLKKPYEINIGELLLGAESTTGRNGFQGCIGTFRWEHQNFPLQQNSSSSGSSQGTSSNTGMISIRQSNGVSRGCSVRPTCASLGSSYCTGSFVCVDFWKGPFCTCPANLFPHLGPDGRLVGCGEILAFSKLGITNNAIIIIMVFLGLLLLMVLLMVVYSRRQTPPFTQVRPVELNRDNIRPYDIEGGGEADNDQYDINGLRKPVMPLEGNGLGGFAPPVYPPQRSAPDDRINTQIKNLEADPDATAPYDELRIFEDEGDAVSRLSLESLESADEGTAIGNLDQQEIGKWGPRFKNLAGIYGKEE